MTALQYLIHPVHGCASAGEIVALAKVDKAAVDMLKSYARVEMTARDIPIDEPAPAKQ